MLVRFGLIPGTGGSKMVLYGGSNELGGIARPGTCPNRGEMHTFSSDVPPAIVFYSHSCH